MNTTNRINRISVQTQADGSIDICVPAGMAEEFKLMVNKGTNTSPNMHVEIRDFVDRLLGQEDIMGACMKAEIYGYPPYVRPTTGEQAVIVVEEPNKIKLQADSIREYITQTLKDPYCQGHPETCNCPYHAG